MDVYKCAFHNEALVLNQKDGGSNWVCRSCELDKAKLSALSLPMENKLSKVEQPVLPLDKEERKKIPIGTGVLDYFPNALAEIARVSYQGNVQHNEGQPLHWSRGKSADHVDTVIRHFMERGKLDNDGMRHTAKLAWRVLAILQLELEAEGAPMARGAKEDK